MFRVRSLILKPGLKINKQRPGPVTIKFVVQLLDGEKMATDCRSDDGNYGLTSLDANIFPSTTGAYPFVVDWLCG